MMKKLLPFAAFIVLLFAVAAMLRNRPWKPGDSWRTPAAGERIGSEEFLVWIDNDHLVAGLPGRTITCYQLGNVDPLWKRTLDGSVEMVAASPDQVFACVGPVASPESHLLVLDATTGKTVRTVTGDEIEKLCGYSYFLPGGIAWLATPGALALVNAGDENEDNVCFLDKELSKVIGRAKAPDHTTGVSTSPGAITVCKMTNQVHVIEAATGHHIKHWGKGNADSAIDARALSSAHGHGDGTLVLVHDNGGWSDGDVAITSAKSPSKFSSGNAHAVTAVDWNHRLVAISGTSKNITLKTLAGKSVAKLENACSERIHIVAFSPAGNHVAALSQAGELKVFDRPD